LESGHVGQHVAPDVHGGQGRIAWQAQPKASTMHAMVLAVPMVMPLP
jgi:hypothetical protein